MDQFDRMRLVGDAVILERAARIIERIDAPGAQGQGTTEAVVVTFLARRAGQLRQEAEEN